MCDSFSLGLSKSFRDLFLNPPNGSWGMFKVQPTPGALLFLNPPNCSWGMFKVQPTPGALLFLNPPNGSWGMFKVQPSPLRLSGANQRKAILVVVAYR